MGRRRPRRPSSSCCSATPRPPSRRHAKLRRLLEARPRPNRRNGLLRARRNIAYHYDLGNDLFELMLDETMTYSCAVFERPDEPLEDAQRRKYRRVCEKLELGPDDRVLEIGCGWGGFALFAAAEYGCTVTGLTISNAQATLARERIAAAGLDRPDRDRRGGLPRPRRLVHEGRLDRDARGDRREAVPDLLRDDRPAARARAGSPASRRSSSPTTAGTATARAPDWIERYVFPGCLIPSLGALARAMATPSRLIDPRGRRDRPALRRDAAPLARALPRAAARRRAGARLRRPLRAHLGLLPRVLRGRPSARGAARRAADALPRVRRMKRPPLYTIFELIAFRHWFARLYRIELRR